LEKTFLDIYITKAIADTRSNDSVRRLHAVTRLKNIQTERAIPTLLVALDDTSFLVREEAASALGKIGQQVEDKKVKAEIIAALANHLSDTYTLHSSLPRVCDHVAEALNQIGTSAALEAVKNWRQSQSE
jgi:HEAT repeat protein